MKLSEVTKGHSHQSRDTHLDGARYAISKYPPFGKASDGRFGYTCKEKTAWPLRKARTVQCSCRIARWVPRGDLCNPRLEEVSPRTSTVNVNVPNYPLELVWPPNASKNVTTVCYNGVSDPGVCKNPLCGVRGQEFADRGYCQGHVAWLRVLVKWNKGWEYIKRTLI